MRAMLIFKYVKKDGYEFVSHLDTLRHIQKTLVRGEIPVKYSQGFNPHMLVFMPSPLGVGIKSEAEYCFVDTDCEAEEFAERYNRACPCGLRLLNAFNVQKKPNLAAQIDSAVYIFKGFPTSIDENEILASSEFFITDKKGEKKEVRDRIIALERSESDLVATLACGSKTLRPDNFAKALEERYGFEFDDTVKTASLAGGVEVEEFFK